MFEKVLDSWLVLVDLLNHLKYLTIEVSHNYERPYCGFQQLEDKI